MISRVVLKKCKLKTTISFEHSIRLDSILKFLDALGQLLRSGICKERPSSLTIVKLRWTGLLLKKHFHLRGIVTLNHNHRFKPKNHRRDQTTQLRWSSPYYRALLCWNNLFIGNMQKVRFLFQHFDVNKIGLYREGIHWRSTFNQILWMVIQYA